MMADINTTNERFRFGVFYDPLHGATQNISMSSDSDDEDFMSDKYLAVSTGSTTQRPPMTYSEKRRRAQLEQERLNEERRTKPRRELEREAREQALTTAINASNVGFQLLKRMGYREGTALGGGVADNTNKCSGVDNRDKVRVDETSGGTTSTENTTPSALPTNTTPGALTMPTVAGRSATGALLEPLPICIKANRAGLGVAEPVEHVVDESMSRSAPIVAVDDYQRRMREVNRARLLHADLVKSRAACEHLDKKNGQTHMSVFWLTDNAAQSNAGADNNAHDEVALVNSENEEHSEGIVDISDGASDRAYEVSGDEAQDSVQSLKATPFVSLSDTEKLVVVTAYLRESYFYCQWCGTCYASLEELTEQCPGDTRDVHDD